LARMSMQIKLPWRWRACSNASPRPECARHAARATISFAHSFRNGSAVSRPTSGRISHLRPIDD
jgi:hypothetical protein